MARKKVSPNTADIRAGAVDPEEIARTELAAAMVPTPDDIVEMLSPLASMLYLQQMAWANYRNWVAWLSDLSPDEMAEQGDLAKIVQINGECIGMLDAGCALIGLIPPEAVTPAELRS